MTHHHTFNGPFPETIQVSRYQKSKTNLDFTEARDSEWQWHQLGHMHSGPRNSFYCLGHFKNVNDDDDDDM